MITIKNDTGNTREAMREEMENKINAELMTAGRLLFPIMATAYHNNGAKVYPQDLCREIAEELKRAGFFCYWSRPSWAYTSFTDFLVTTKPESLGQFGDKCEL